MNINKIENIIKQKESFQNLENFKDKYYNNLGSLLFFIFLFLEMTILFPMIGIVLNLNTISILFGLISFFGYLFYSLNFNKPFGLSGILFNIIQKNIKKEGIDPDSLLGDLLYGKFLSRRNIKKVKNYHDSLNDIQKEFYSLSMYDYEDFLFFNLQEYISKNNVNTIKENKKRLTDILVDELSLYKREKVVVKLKKKLEEDKEIQKSNILNIFEEEEQDKEIIKVKLYKKFKVN